MGAIVASGTSGRPSRDSTAPVSWLPHAVKRTPKSAAVATARSLVIGGMSRTIGSIGDTVHGPKALPIASPYRLGGCPRHNHHAFRARMYLSLECIVLGLVYG